MEERHSDEKPQQESKKLEKKVEVIYDKSSQNEEKTSRILELLSHPWKLIKEGGKLGLNGIKHFLTVLLLFGLTNIILFFYSLNRLFITAFEVPKLLYVLLIFVLGLGITLYAVRRAYQYIIIDTIRVIYENLSSLFHKIAESITDTLENIFDVEVDLTENQLTKALNFGMMINSTYDMIPKFLRTGIIRILNKIPWVGILIDLKEDLIKGNKFEANLKLYNKMDGFIGEMLFEDNNTYWIWWLLPLNILTLVLIIKFGIG